MRMQKNSLVEEIVMLTYNMFETIHNILSQEYGKKGSCLCATTLNDYVRAFRQ
jgi:hypothetical protein